MRLADEAYALGAAETADTYLNIDAMASAAVRAHADAVHPGHGFLAENADFAQAVIDAGMVWVGPKPETIRVLGSKVAARRIAAEVVEFAREHGLPIAIKAVYGGGGRGLKVVHEPDEVAAAFESAMHEAEVAFGNGDCFVERFLARLWHVEVQVLGDQFGTVLAVGTRDCCCSGATRSSSRRRPHRSWLPRPCGSSSAPRWRSAHARTTKARERWGSSSTTAR